jgi:hypothetical protein
MLVLACSRAAAGTFNFPPSDFEILDAESNQLVGIGHYGLDRTSAGMTLHGENHYFDGEYDIEDDKLADRGGDSLPTLLTFEHNFFNRDGSPLIVARLDTATGLGVCGKTEDGKLDLTQAQFRFPSDIYGGASVLLPIQQMMSDGDRSKILKLHVFNCAPTPKVIAVDLKAQPREDTFVDYPGELERVDVKPDFGFWTVVIEPFIPKLAVWFDPSRAMLLVGAQLQRYYKGPKIILLRKREAEISKDEQDSGATVEMRREAGETAVPRPPTSADAVAPPSPSWERER